MLSIIYHMFMLSVINLWKAVLRALEEKFFSGADTEILAAELGITKTSNLFAGMKDVAFIKVDVLKKISEHLYFNVTTDYLLGMSDMKRDLTGQLKKNEVVDEYYDQQLDLCI